MNNSSRQLLIAHVVYRFDIGGLENGVVNLINRLPEATWRHAVIALTDVSPTFSRRVQRRDVQYVSVRKPLGHLWKVYPRLSATLRTLQPAVVHTRNLAALEAVVPAWRAGVPVRIHGEHGRDATDPEGALRRYQWVRRVYGPFVSRYVAVSKDLERYLQTRVGVRADKIVQLYNGVDTERFHPAHGARIAIDGCPFRSSDHWLVGTVGRMDPVKDQCTLARAFVLAVGMTPSAQEHMRLVLVGDGALRAECERILEEGRVRHLAWFAGDRNDVPEIMRGLDCFILPSLGEGISNTILEAMSCAIPVVATRVGGNSELVNEGITGRLVPPADPVALMQAMIFYFNNRALARQDGVAGRKRVKESFSLQRMADAYHDLYLSELRITRGASARAVSSMPSAES